MRGLKPARAEQKSGLSPDRLTLDETNRLIADLDRRISEAEQPNPRLAGLRERFAHAETSMADVQARFDAGVKHYIADGEPAPEPATSALRAAQAKVDDERRFLAPAETAETERGAHAAYLRELRAAAVTRQRTLIAALLYSEAAPAVLKRLQVAIIAANKANAAARALAIMLGEQYRGLTPGLAPNLTTLSPHIPMPDYSAHPGIDPALLDLNGINAAARSTLTAFVEALTSDAAAELPDTAA